MMTYKKQISILATAVAMTLAMVSEANAVTFPFTGAKVTPSQDVIAANLDEITPQNTVTVVHNITQVTPTLTASQMPNPTSASFGVVTAFNDPNMSQAVPDCTPPPTPPPNCNNIGQCGSPGSVSWSGWDKVSGGVCDTGDAGGWLVTAAGPAPANYYTALNSASGIFANGMTIRCNGGACTVTYGVGNGYKITPVTLHVSLYTLENGGFYLPGSKPGSKDPTSVSIVGGDVVTTNQGLIVITNAATNIQDGGSSIAQQEAQIAAATAKDLDKVPKSEEKRAAHISQRGARKLDTKGDGANTSLVSQAILDGYG